jgi:hypothetical protein
MLSPAICRKCRTEMFASRYENHPRDRIPQGDLWLCSVDGRMFVARYYDIPAGCHYKFEQAVYEGMHKE